MSSINLHEFGYLEDSTFDFLIYLCAHLFLFTAKNDMNRSWLWRCEHSNKVVSLLCHPGTLYVLPHILCHLVRMDLRPL